MLRKIMKYQNSRGMSLCFGYKKPYFLENIDATGVSGIFSSDSFARYPGQITNFKKVAARTIVCDLAVWITDEKHRNDILDYITNLFNPLETGILTIKIDNGQEYEIECYPSSVPSILRDKNVRTIYRFTLDFICDYPYFRKSGEITKEIIQAYTKIYSHSAVNVPIKIHFPSGAIFTNQTTNQGFTISGTSDGVGVTVDTKNFTIIDDNGNDVSNLISIADDIGDVYLKPGWNDVFCASDLFPITVKFYDLSLGVI